MSISDPPPYTPSDDHPPDYNLLQHNTFIQRRIRTLESECVESVAQLRELRDSAIAQPTTEVDLQIEGHVARYRDTITCLENLISP